MMPLPAAARFWPHFRRRSRALASMLPALLVSGSGTLAVTALMHPAWIAGGHDFFGRWMEAWLTSWPIAFPIAYLAGLVLQPLAARLADKLVDSARQSGA